MTVLEILAEIEKLKKELGLLPPREFKCPKGSSTCANGTRGRCIVCDVEYEAEDTIRRCAKTRSVRHINRDTKKEYVTYHVVGYRVCYRCCPTMKDWQLERFGQGVDDWQERWKSYQDTGVFGSRAVITGISRLEELETVAKAIEDKELDDENEYLARKITELEKKLGLPSIGG